MTSDQCSDTAETSLHSGLAAASCLQSTRLPWWLFLLRCYAINGIQDSAWHPEVPMLQWHNRCTAQLIVVPLKVRVMCTHTHTITSIVCCSCHSNMDCGWTGGQEEALMHYEDAMTAVFSLQLNRHHHVQPYRSKKDGKIKWATFEMWPMSVSPQL